MRFTALVTLSLMQALSFPSQASTTANSGVSVCGVWILYIYTLPAKCLVSGDAACRRRFLVVGEVAVARSLVACEV